MPARIPAAGKRGVTRPRADRGAAARRRDPEWSDRRIASKLGCDHPTVTAVRAELESTGKIYQLDRLLGEDGKWRKNKRKTNRQSLPSRRASRRRGCRRRLLLPPASRADGGVAESFADPRRVLPPTFLDNHHTMRERQQHKRDGADRKPADARHGGLAGV
jgi:hypothetical protein